MKLLVKGVIQTGIIWREATNAAALGGVVRRAAGKALYRGESCGIVFCGLVPFRQFLRQPARHQRRRNAGARHAHPAAASRPCAKTSAQGGAVIRAGMKANSCPFGQRSPRTGGGIVPKLFTPHERRPHGDQLRAARKRIERACAGDAASCGVKLCFGEPIIIKAAIRRVFQRRALTQRIDLAGHIIAQHPQFDIARFGLARCQRDLDDPVAARWQRAVRPPHWAAEQR